MSFRGLLLSRSLNAVAAAGLLVCLGCVPKRPGATPLRQTAGAALFDAKGCTQCHEINGRGGDKGPGLTHVGRRLSTQKIEKQILEGGDMMPAYNDVLTPDETRLLVRYLHKLR